MALARQVLPDLPDQTMDLGDGNCTYSDPPDASNQVTTVEFVRPYDNQPGWAAQAQTRMATGGHATPVAVGDGGFCADQGGGAIVVGWRRGSTGFELDAFSPSASCANVTTLALALNNSL